VNREDSVDRAWPRDHLPSGGARRPRAGAPNPKTPASGGAAGTERTGDDESATPDQPRPEEETPGA
jgi:hypothetical protein